MTLLNKKKNNIEKKSNRARPFIKWAGGKTQLLETIDRHFPKELKAGKIEKYFEPFTGSGAVFFHIKNNYPSVKKFYLSDINPELILVYKIIQKEVERLIEHLEKLSKDYLPASEEKRKDYYYKLRASFNYERKKINLKKVSEETIRRAARFIFLNRTCFNGLFRVNRSGGFNVPIGRYKNPAILNRDNLYAVSEALQNVYLSCRDYWKTKKLVCNNSLVYFDPPYRPLNRTSSFTSYSKHEFDDRAQIRLCRFFHSLDEKGAKLLLSNSDPHNTDSKDNFFDELYKDFSISRIMATRIINCNSDKRGKIKELLIKNF